MDKKYEKENDPFKLFNELSSLCYTEEDLKSLNIIINVAHENDSIIFYEILPYNKSEVKLNEITPLIMLTTKNSSGIQKDIISKKFYTIKKNERNIITLNKKDIKDSKVDIGCFKKNELYNYKKNKILTFYKKRIYDDKN